MQICVSHCHRTKYGFSKAFHKRLKLFLSYVNFFFPFTNVGRKKLDGTWLLEHIILLGFLYPYTLLLLRLFRWPLSHPPKLLLLEGPRAWCLALSFSICSLSPVTSFSTIAWNSIYMSTTPKYVFTLQVAQIQTYIPNCLFNSASRCLIVISKGTEHVGQITTEELNTTVKHKTMEAVKRSMVARTLRSGRDEQI